MDATNPIAGARVRFRRPPAEVFAAFADADKMSRFWFTRRDSGLVAGSKSTWYLGSGEDAYAFDVLVREISNPGKIVIEWEGPDGHTTEVKWLFEEAGEGETILTIEESGFAGERDAIIERQLDSTAGFNQVIIAAKALVEHDVALNLVADHA